MLFVNPDGGNQLIQRNLFEIHALILSVIIMEWVANMVYVGLQTFVLAKLVGKEQIVKFALDYPVV